MALREHATTKRQEQGTLAKRCDVMKNLMQEVQAVYRRKERITGLPGVLCFRIVTPAVRVIHAIWQVDGWPGIITTAIDDAPRQPASISVLSCFIDFLRQRWDGNLKGNMILLPGYSAKYPEEPDAALLLPPTYHYAFEVEAPSLQPMTIQALPVYHCEFSGMEDRDEYRDCLATWPTSEADWSRVPAPRLLVGSHEWRDARKYKRRLAYARPRTLVEPIQNMKESEELEIRNFREQEVRIRKRKGSYVILNRATEVLQCPNSVSVLDFLTGWLLDDVSVPSPALSAWRTPLFGV